MGAAISVRFGPIADATSFKHLVGGDHQALRDGHTERLSGPEVDEYLKLRGSLHRQITGFLASQDAAGIDAGEMIGIGDTGTVAQQFTSCRELAAVKDCRDLVANGECGEFRGLAEEE